MQHAVSICYQLQPLFPEVLNKLLTGRSSDLSPKFSPSHLDEIRAVASWKFSVENYSSGYCSGFSPDSLL